ncbi:hypothetical protein C8J56DRAFT_1068528 [Mycena floridula]|nr:hypothetical protein C8J56DRAFT_1068528 [Mycena floridula]
MPQSECTSYNDSIINRYNSLQIQVAGAIHSHLGDAARLSEKCTFCDTMLAQVHQYYTHFERSHYDKMVRNLLAMIESLDQAVQTSADPPVTPPPQLGSREPHTVLPG